MTARERAEALMAELERYGHVDVCGPACRSLHVDRLASALHAHAEAAVQAAVGAEREACARIAEEYVLTRWDAEQGDPAGDIAAAIRARGAR